MRKGFTMIELIFVIVILGVLASVAIPRLAATRDDAEVAKAATNLTTAISDLTAYYTAKGSFYEYEKDSKGNNKSTTKKVSDFSKITNALSKNGHLMVKSKKCVKVDLPDLTKTSNGQTTFNDVKIKLTFDVEKDAACATLRTLPGILTMCGKSGTSTDTIAENGTCEIQVGGSGGIAW